MVIAETVAKINAKDLKVAEAQRRRRIKLEILAEEQKITRDQRTVTAKQIERRNKHKLALLEKKLRAKDIRSAEVKWFSMDRS
eukprot:SAG11_NODE_4174_length_2027_cov_2.128631_3_plen_83_part_00